MRVSEILGTQLDESNDPIFGDSTDTNYRVLMYQPSHVEINPDAKVSVVQDTRSVFSGTWSEAYVWINDNWNNLTGQYYVARDGIVLHQFRVSNRG